MYFLLKHKLIFTALSILILNLIFGGAAVFSVTDISKQVMGQVDAGAKGADLSGAIDPRLAIVGVITVVLETIGIIFTALLVYGGYNYFTSHGEEEKAKKGSDIIRMAIVGLIIIMISYSITVFLGSRMPALVTEGGEIVK